MSGITIDARDEFEKIFPIPKHVIRCGKGYACTEYNAWCGHEFINKWEGWNAAMKQVTLTNKSDKQDGNPQIMPDYEGTAMTQRECFRARLEAGKAPAPDGWKLEPIELAPEMRKKIHPMTETDCPDCGKRVAADCEENVIMSWDDMLAAAPQPPVSTSGWIKCRDRLPPEEYESDGGAVCYLVWYKNKIDCGPQYGISNVVFLRKYWEKWFTHWMPLPAAPQEVK